MTSFDQELRISNVVGHHTARFDIDEGALEIGVDVVVETVRSLGAVVGSPLRSTP